MTKTDLLLLGLLLERPMHGYELYQQIQSECIDDWFHVSAAGVYYSLRKMRDHALVSESRQRSGGSAHKSIFRLTDQGRSTFFETMETELASDEMTYLDYDLAVYLLNKFPRQRAVPQLEQHQIHLAQQAQRVEEAIAAEMSNGRSALRLALLDHKSRFLQMEQTWLADVIQRVRENGATGPELAEGETGLLVLSGDLRDYHLPDLLCLILAGKHNGTLTVTDGAEVRTLVFEAGQSICASFVRRGDPPQILSSCNEIISGLCEVFRWREGRFRFDQNGRTSEGCVPLDCTTEDLILRGCRKVDNWTIIQRLVPSADTIFELSATSADLERLDLMPAEERLLKVIDGVRDVSAIGRDLDLTLFETSRMVYCLAAIGVLRTADPDKIRLRRVFREIAELVCRSTVSWRADPDDRSCEEEVNQRVQALPIRLNHGRIEDQVDPQCSIDEMQEIYQVFLRKQLRVVSSRFGRVNARQAFDQALRQLAPELQGVARRYGFDKLHEEL
jgi:DNA-binding PadR family transcriptional regulator